MIMSKGIDRIMTAEAERDWCGCPIVAGITAHLAACDLGASGELGEPEYADWLDAPAGYED